MATRKSQIIIDVDDKSLIQLNNEILELQSSIDGLTIGTEEWIQKNEKLGDLKRKFNEVTGEAEKLQGQIEKISGPQQIQSIAKLGNGLVGAFAGVSGTIDLLGIQNEELEKITAKATALTSIMGGLNAIADAFSKESIDGLKALGGGFLNLTRTVKTASTAMKTALVATGIGAIVVAVGLLAANWEKVISVLDGSKRVRKQWREDQEKLIEGYNDESKLLEEQLGIIEEIRDFYTTDFADASLVVYQNIIDQNNALQRQIDLNNDLLEQGKKREEGSDAELQRAEERVKNAEKALAIAKSGTRQDEQKIKFYEEELEKEKRRLDIANQNNIAIKLQNANLELQLKFNNEILDNRNRAIELASEENRNSEISISLSESELILLNQREQKITTINGLIENAAKIRKEEKNIIQEQINQLERIRDNGGDLTIEEGLRLVTLNKQLAVIDEQFALKVRDLKQLREQLEFLVKQQDLNAKINDELSRNSKEYTEILNNLESISEKYELNSQRIDFQTKLLGEQGDLAEKQLEIETFLDEAKGRTVLRAEKLIEIKRNELNLYVQEKEFENESLRNNINLLENEKSILQVKQQQIDSEINIADQRKVSLQNEIDRNLVLFEQAKSDEERFAIRQSIVDLQQQQKDIDQEVVDLQGEQIQNANEMSKIEFEIAKSTEEIAINQADITLETEKTTQELEKQEQVISKLQNAMERYSAEIQAAQQAISAGFELASAIFDRRAAVAQETLDGLNQEIAALETEVSDVESERLRLEEELKDANGERYDELLMQIDSLKNQEVAAKEAVETKQLEIDEKNNERLKAEYDAAKWRKVQALVDAAIQTALAVIKSLPNVPLSILTGVLGAAGIATIATQKLPPKPEGYASGGYTGDGDPREVAGYVHKNEYIVPAPVVKSASGQAHIAALEKQRTKGYQGGGLVTPVNEQVNSSIDYEAFGKVIAEAVSKLPNPQVALVDISNGLNEVQLTKQNASFNRG